MPAITTNDLKNGITLNLDNGLFQVVDFQHVKPGKGGAFVRTKLRNVRTGAVLDRTFNAGVKVDQAIVSKQDMQFLYRDGDDYVFMNTSTYEQIHVSPAALGDTAGFLVEQAVAQIALYEGEIIGVEIPASVELAVRDTEPGVQGDRVSGARKSATLETGKVLQVPLFVEVGDRVKVDTRSGEYITRVLCVSVSQLASKSLVSPAELAPPCPPPPSAPRGYATGPASLWRLTLLKFGEMNRRPDARSDARERALYLLYEAASKRIDPIDVLEVQLIEPDPLTGLLVRGVSEQMSELDERIQRRATGWTLERMPVLDLNVLRLGLFELIARPEVPIAVVIDEAVELAKRYSTDDSGRFVNGVLAALARDVRPEAPAE